jgi:hypothetical protein
MRFTKKKKQKKIPLKCIIKKHFRGGNFVSYIILFEKGQLWWDFKSEKRANVADMAEEKWAWRSTMVKSSR